MCVPGHGFFVPAISRGSIVLGGISIQKSWLRSCVVVARNWILIACYCIFGPCVQKAVLSVRVLQGSATDSKS